MTGPLNDAELDRLMALAESATPGPWEANVLGSEGYDVRAPATPDVHRLHRMRIARCGYEAWETDKANAAFIAAAREAVPALVKALREARAEVERANAVADSMDHFAEVAVRVESRNNELAAERDALRERLARVKAVVPTMRVTAEEPLDRALDRTTWRGAWLAATARIDAALADPATEATPDSPICGECSACLCSSCRDDNDRSCRYCGHIPTAQPSSTTDTQGADHDQ